MEEANRELTRRVHDLLGIYDVLLAINSSREVDAIFDLIAQSLVAMVGADSCMTFLCDAGTHKLGRQLGLGILQETTADSEIQESQLSAHVIRSKSPVEVEDTGSEDNLDCEILIRRGLRAFMALPLRTREKTIGLLIVGFAQPHTFDERERGIIKLIAEQSALAIENFGLMENVERQGKELRLAWDQMVQYAHDLRHEYDAERQRSAQLHKAYLSAIKVLAAAVEARDPYTGGHIERVTTYCVAIARELGWDDKRIAQVEMGAALHDIGKIGVEDAILRKPSKLTMDEYRQMKAHPEIAARMLEGIDFLEPVIPYVLYHQERYDGMGYPYGLSGEEIPIEGRLVAVADGFDAMTSDRPYRASMSPEEAIAELRRCAGNQFDPQIVDAFTRAWAAAKSS